MTSHSARDTTSSPAARARRKLATRRRLIAVATKLFARSGLAATRTADVARAARVSHGTVFLHFGTRDDLLAEVIAGFGAHVVSRMHELADGGRGVRDVLAAHLKGLAEHEDFYARLVSEAPVLPEAARDTLFGIQSAASSTLFKAAEREMDAGLIERMPMHLLFNTWIGLLHHYLVNRDLFAPGGSVLARRGEELLDHYTHLLAPKR